MLVDNRRLQTLSFYGVRDAAHLCDGLGAYELGERVFKFTSDSRGNTLAATCGFTGHDSDRHEIATGRLNRTVEKVYGPASLQMARRLESYANHLNFNSENDVAEVERAQQRAIQIYRSLNRSKELGTNLGFIAYNQIRLHRRDEARRSVEAALKISRTLPAKQRQQVEDSCISALWALGDKELAKQLGTPRASTYLSQQGSFAGSGRALSLISGFLLFVVIAIPEIKYLFLERISSNWARRCAASSDVQTKLLWLRRLTNLALYRRRMKLADAHSRQMLEIAKG